MGKQFLFAGEAGFAGFRLAEEFLTAGLRIRVRHTLASRVLREGGHAV